MTAVGNYSEDNFIFLDKISEDTLLSETKEWYEEEIKIQHKKVPKLTLPLFHKLKLRFVE